MVPEMHVKGYYRFYVDDSAMELVKEPQEGGERVIYNKW